MNKNIKSVCTIFSLFFQVNIQYWLGYLFCMIDSVKNIMIIKFFIIGITEMKLFISFFRADEC